MDNEYVVSKSSLISVANAIRSKGETSDQLVFPDGFVTAIHGISELNFEVVGGKDAPDVPKPNMIWVNTETEITGWSFRATEPEEYVEGDVWFVTVAASDVSFNALSKNEIRVYPTIAKQRINDAWEEVPVKCYISGEWVDFWDVRIFKDGQFYNCNGFLTVNATSSVLDGVLTLTTTGNVYSLAYSDTLIDLTYADEIVVKFNESYSYVDGLRGVCVCKNIPQSPGNPSGMESLTTFASSYFKGQYIIDTAKLTGEYYLLFSFAGSGAGNGRLYITDIEMRSVT